MTTNLWKRFTGRRQRRKQKLADEYSTLSAAERATVDRLREGHRRHRRFDAASVIEPRG